MDPIIYFIKKLQIYCPGSVLLDNVWTHVYKYGEGGSRFVFRRDDEGTKRNDNSKLSQKSNNISNNIFALPLNTNLDHENHSHINRFKEIQQHSNSSNNISKNPTTKSNNFLSSRVKSSAQIALQ